MSKCKICKLLYNKLHNDLEEEIKSVAIDKNFDKDNPIIVTGSYECPEHGRKDIELSFPYIISTNTRIKVHNKIFQEALGGEFGSEIREITKQRLSEYMRTL